VNKISEALSEIYRVNSENQRSTRINKIHPLSKLLITVLYILVLVSFSKYDLESLSAMILYPLITILLYNISIKECLNRLKPIFIIVFAVGIVNPFIDRRVIGYIFNIAITSGVISMLTLIFKGVFAVLASYILIVTTSIERICNSLRIFHVPKIIVSVIFFIYRYIIVLLQETERLINAYELRAPGQKGVNFKAWGSLVGILLLKSIGRAEEVYESMILRGYNGEYYIKSEEMNNIESVFYFFIWGVLILLFRFIPIFDVVGRLLIK